MPGLAGDFADIPHHFVRLAGAALASIGALALLPNAGLASIDAALASPGAAKLLPRMFKDMAGKCEIIVFSLFLGPRM